MKKISWKKIVSLVVAFALVVSVAHFGTRVSAGDVNEGTGAKASKTEDGTAFTFDVTRASDQIDGTQDDVSFVLVIDTSSSMNNNHTDEEKERYWEYTDSYNWNARWTKADSEEEAEKHARYREVIVYKTRLEVAIDEAKSFLGALSSDNKIHNVAVTADGKPAVITFNSNTSLVAVEDMDSIVNGTGTHIDEAMQYAQNVFAEDAKHPTIIILTDGEAYDNSGSNSATTKAVNAINEVLADGIAVYAIQYGDIDNYSFEDRRIVDTNNNLHNKESGYNSSELAAAFAEIKTEMQSFKIVGAFIETHLTQFIEYTGVNDGEIINYDKDQNVLIWNIEDVKDVSSDAYKTPDSPEFTFKLVDPDNANATQEQIIRALINHAKSGSTVDGKTTSADGIVSYSKKDGKVTITVKISDDTATTLYYYINTKASTKLSKPVNGLDTFTLSYNEDMPQDTWTVVYTVDGEVEETEEPVTFKADCDATLDDIVDIAKDYTLEDYDNNEDYDLGTITAAVTNDGNIVTIPYEYNKVAWKVVYQIDGEDVETDTQTYAKVDKNEPFETLENIKTPEDLGYGDYTFDEDEPEKDRDYDSKKWTVNYISVPTVNYFIGDNKIGQKQGEEVELTDDGVPVFLNPSDLSTDDIVYADVDFDLDKTDVKKVDGVKVWNVYFTEKGNVNWTIIYLIENKDGKFDETPEVKQVKVSEADKFDYVNAAKTKDALLGEKANLYKDAETSVNAEKREYTLTYKIDDVNYTVKYVVDGQGVDEKTPSVKYNLETGKAELNIDEYKVPVSTLGNYADDEYNAPSVSEPEKNTNTYTITYTKIQKQELPEPPVDPEPTQQIINFTPDPPTPTEIPATPTPTQEPTPTPEPVVDVEEPETPEGDVVEDLEPVDTPQSAPEEEELDVEPIDTPQGDLPKTGVASTGVFLGIGAACVLFGGVIAIKNRRKEEM